MSKTSRRMPLDVASVAALALCGPCRAQAAAIDDLFGDAPIVQAAREGSVEDTNAALSAAASVHTRAADGTPVLVLAVAARSLDVVKLLDRKRRAARRQEQEDETTALTLAAANGDLEIVDLSARPQGRHRSSPARCAKPR